NLNASLHAPAALIYPARDTGHLTVRPNSTVSEVLIDAPTNRAAGVPVIDSVTREVFDFEARVVVMAASTLESTRLLLLSRNADGSRGLANSSGVLGRYFCAHGMGPGGGGGRP